MAWQPIQPQGSAGGGYNEFGVQPGMQRPPVGGPPNPLNDVLYGAVGDYGQRFFGTSRQYVQSNVSKYFATHDVQYYFQVNDQYVKNKLKVVLFPFLHKHPQGKLHETYPTELGHWTRIAEQVAGGLRYKPPRHDINAPDLYVPLMAFATYVVLCGLALGITGKFTPDVMSGQFTKALIGWTAETVLLKSMLFALHSGDAPTLDVVAYGGYAFIGVCVSLMARMLSDYAYYVVWPCTAVCMGTFLVKTMKRLLFAEARSYDRDSTRHHYVLLLMAVVQFPLFYWLVRVR